MSELATPTHLLQLTEDEINQIRADMESGLLPPNYASIVAEQRGRFVFGHDAKKDRHGNFIEQGIGSPGNETANSVQAFEKYCKNEPDFERQLALKKKNLAECEARRKAAARPQF